MKLAVVGMGHWGELLVKKFKEGGHTIYKFDKDYFDSWGAAKTIADMVHAVVIATPNNTHYALAREFILKNKPVWVEKPLATNYADARELVELSEASGTILMVDHQLIYYQAVRWIKLVCQIHKPIQIVSTRLGWNSVKHGVDPLWNLAPHSFSIIGELIEGFDDINNPELQVQNFGNYAHISGILNNTGIIVEVASNWPETQRGTIITLNSEPLQTYSFNENTNAIRGWVEDQEMCNMSFYDNDPLGEACKDFIESIKENKEPKSSAKRQLKVYEVLGG